MVGRVLKLISEFEMGLQYCYWAFLMLPFFILIGFFFSLHHSEKKFHFLEFLAYLEMIFNGEFDYILFQWLP